MIWTTDDKIHEWLPRLQAHRGYWVKGLQQNSLEAIRAAYELGYEMVEFDVRVTADDKLILFHDDYFSNRPVRKTSLDNLRAGIPVTTLEELFVWFSRTQNFKLNLEIKSKSIFTGAVEREIFSLIQKYALHSRILISSFNPMSLFRFRMLDSRIYRALLLTYKKENGNNWIVRSMLLNFLCRPHVLHLRYNDYSDVFKKISSKVPVVLWTVNEIGLFKKLNREIHGIISDEIIPADIKS